MNRFALSPFLVIAFCAHTLCLPGCRPAPPDSGTEGEAAAEGDEEPVPAPCFSAKGACIRRHMQECD